MGGEFKELNFSFIDVCVPIYIVLTTSEASSNLARLDSVRYGSRVDSCDGIDLTYGMNLLDKDTDNAADYLRLSRGNFGQEVKRRLLMGTYFLSNENNINYISKAKKIRSSIRKSVSEAFNNVDIIFTPTTTTAAFKSNERANDPVSMYLSDYFTISANVAGNPAISIPVGKDNKGLPIGMQLQTNS